MILELALLQTQMQKSSDCAGKLILFEAIGGPRVRCFHLQNENSSPTCGLV
jgi:hypothetical protein